MKKILLLLCAIGMVGGADAKNWYASPTGTGSGETPEDRGEPITLSRKMGTGDTLYFAPGTYQLDKTKSESQDVGSGVYFRLPTKSKENTVSRLTFIGEGEKPEDVRLVGNPADKMRIFYCRTGQHTIRNLLISGGYTEYQGAGLCVDNEFFINQKHEAAFSISNCIVENCSAKYQGSNAGGIWYDCVIRNNTVRGGKDAGGNTVEGSGGGIFCATLHRCTITNNSAQHCGGGVAGGLRAFNIIGERCPTTAYDCLIGWNKAHAGGGAGVYTIEDPTLCTLVRCTLIGNRAELGDGATHHGGGAYMCTVADSTLANNYCIQNGGAAYKSLLTDCRLIGNLSDLYGGGAAYCENVTRCLFAGNKATHGGAGFYGSFKDCIMTNNVAGSFWGGATYNATTRNCLVMYNRAKAFAHCRGAHYGDLVCHNENTGTYGYAGGIGADNSNEILPVVNCTVWGNNGAAQISYATLTNTITSSVIDMGNNAAVNSFWKSGTIANQTACISGVDQDPKFLDPGATAPWKGYKLKISSPCRDAGRTLPGQTAETDALKNPRVKGTCVDMGAFEYAGPFGFSVKIM